MDENIKFFLGEVKNIPLRSFYGLEIIFLVRGEAALEIDGARYRMEAEDVAVCHADNLRSMQSEAQNLTLRILLSGEYLRSEAGIFNTGIFTCNSASAGNRNGRDFFELRRIITRLMFAHYSDRDEARLETKSLLFQLLLLLKTAFSRASAEQKKKVLPGPDTDDPIENAAAYINMNFRSQLTLRDVADHTGFSVHYLSRLFKRRTGKGFLEYLGEVRLQNAVAELTSSKESILKIALGSGFSNAASFNKVFQKRFGMTPVKYRAQNRGGDKGQLLSVEEFLPEKGSVEREFLKYLARYDIRHIGKNNERHKYEIDMSAQPSAIFSLPVKIAKLGRLAELLKHEVRAQLEDARTKLDFQVLHFRVLFGDGTHRYEKNSLYNFYEYEIALSYIAEAGFKPVFQIDAAALFLEAELLGSYEACLERIRVFLSNCSERWGAGKIDEWQFEIYGRDIPVDAFYPLYRTVLKIIRGFSGQAKVGFSAASSVSAPEIGRFAALLELCAQENITVDFVTLYAYPLKHFELYDDNAYLAFREYHRALAVSVRNKLDEYGLDGCDIVMMDWNTLTGTGVHADYFYRAAVILEAILSVRDHVKGMGFWLNSHMYETVTGKADNTIIAVFLHMHMKRPIYFVLSLLTLMRPYVVYSGEDMIVTRDEAGVYTLLAYNPSYFNPAYAADDKFLESLGRTLDLRLGQWRGPYVFERYILDMNSGAIYNKWAQMGFPSLLRPEIAEYVDMVVKPNLSMFVENIEGSYSIFHQMRFNSILLYVISPA